MEFRAYAWDYANEYHLALIDRSGSGRIAAASEVSLTLREQKENEPLPTFLKLRRQAAQSLINALYSAGLRPTDATPESTTVEAMRYHLEDMRKIALAHCLPTRKLEQSND